jgi:hypothetical protein
MGKLMDDVTSFQSVVQLFLLRYHGGAISARVSHDDEEPLNAKERNYRLLLSYGLDPEFRLAITREIAANPSSGEWLEELGFVLGLELLLSKNGNWLYKRIISEERKKELDEAYPEVFGQVMGGASSFDELISAAASARRSVEPEFAPLKTAVDALFPEGFEVSSAIQALHRHGSFLNLEPGWIEDLDDFQQSLAENIRQIMIKLGDRPEIDVDQLQQMQGRNASVELIFCIANEAVALRWFRGLIPEEQERALTSTMELTWDEERLTRAIERRFTWCKDPVQGSRAAMDAAESYRQYGESDAAIYIYRTLLNAPQVKDREKAESHNRMAVIHREEGRQHDAFLEFQEAGIIWEALKAPWEGAVTSAFVAEGYSKEGKKEKANKYLEEAFTGMSRATEGKEKMARGYFYLAGCASTLGRLDLERLALERGLVFAQFLEDGELFLELNDRLMSLPS